MDLEPDPKWLLQKFSSHRHSWEEGNPEVTQWLKKGQVFTCPPDPLVEGGVCRTGDVKTLQQAEVEEASFPIAEVYAAASKGGLLPSEATGRQTMERRKGCTIFWTFCSLESGDNKPCFTMTAPTLWKAQRGSTGGHQVTHGPHIGAPALTCLDFLVSSQNIIFNLFQSLLIWSWLTKGIRCLINLYGQEKRQI